jgi:hypothetical protein
LCDRNGRIVDRDRFWAARRTQTVTIMWEDI